jgi:arylsulfatase A-like enzyme
MLVNDHQVYYRHGWDGSTRPLRPCFDRLAAAGTSFQRAYAVAPLCVPVRTSLVTGLYPHHHGNVRNDTNAPFNHELIFTALQRAGYHNFYFGKWHAGAGMATDFGPDGFSREGYGNPYLSREYRAYLGRLGLPMPERIVEKVFTKPDFTKQHPDLVEGNQSYISDKFFSGENAVGLSRQPAATHESFFLADLAIRSLDAASHEEQPFFMRVDFWGPHHPHFPSPEFASLYDPATIPMYPSFNDNLVGRPALYRDTYTPLSDADGQLRWPNPLPMADWQLIMARAYAHVTQVDAAGGMVLDALDRLGLADNTLVIWTTDHGDALGSHGGQWDKGSYMTEEVMRVPLALRWPGTIPAGTVHQELVNSVDLPATILDAASAAFHGPQDGCSLLPVCRGDLVAPAGPAASDPAVPDMTAPDTANSPEFPIDQKPAKQTLTATMKPVARWREALLCETYGIGFGRNHFGKCLITNRYKYIWNRGDIEELYDLHSDPYELVNLAGAPGTADLLAGLRGSLLRQLEDVRAEHDEIHTDYLTRGAAFEEPAALPAGSHVPASTTTAVAGPSGEPS